MRSDWSTCPPFEDDAEQEPPAPADEEEAPLDELLALERPPCDRTVRRDLRKLEEARDAWTEDYEDAREAYEQELAALLKPQGALQRALVENLAAALARYDSFEAMETVLQRQLFVLSPGRPPQVLLDLSAWQKYARNAFRVRKSLQNNILKLIHEIERLQASAAGEKTHPVHVVDSNSG